MVYQTGIFYQLREKKGKEKRVKKENYEKWIANYAVYFFLQILLTDFIINFDFFFNEY